MKWSERKIYWLSEAINIVVINPVVFMLVFYRPKKHSFIDFNGVFDFSVGNVSDHVLFITILAAMYIATLLSLIIIKRYCLAKVFVGRIDKHGLKMLSNDGLQYSCSCTIHSGDQRTLSYVKSDYYIYYLAQFFIAFTVVDHVSDYFF
jgi:hypothetical protein